MDDRSLPKVLAISLSAWRSDSGIHTQTDLFKFWDSRKVAQIYTKSDMPNTPVCNKFFQISENAIIHSVLNRKPVGKEVENGGDVDQRALAAECKLYEKAHRGKSWFMTLMREVVWMLGRWRTPALDKFVGDFDADVYFIPIYPVIYTAQIQQYVLKKFPKPYVCYLADDNYSYLPCGKNLFAYIHRFFLRRVVRRLAENCDEMFTITKIEAEDTDRLFGTKSVVLTKGIDYSKLSFEEKKVTGPVRMVYTGNLLIGRASSLVAISKALANINKDNEVMTLDIYSPTVLGNETMRWLNSNGCRFRGSVPKEQVAEIQKNADVVVFVESLDTKHRFDARLSFSTKLTDYFASGKCIFAIGDKSIAPIQYLFENDAAIISTEYEQVEGQLCKLVSDHNMINEYGRKAFECGKRNHDQPAVKKTFLNTIKKAARKVKV
ncbi:MAG: hypothetical protein J6A62_02280 [Oscillospiraceae bacterium]|nr:hypothetical protein [Oscillospiraceae bacterium]